MLTQSTGRSDLISCKAEIESSSALGGAVKGAVEDVNQTVRHSRRAIWRVAISRWELVKTGWGWRTAITQIAYILVPVDKQRVEKFC